MKWIEDFGWGVAWLLWMQAEAVLAVYCFQNGWFYWTAIMIVSFLKSLVAFGKMR